jgi:hypothetical protein
MCNTVKSISVLELVMVTYYTDPVSASDSVIERSIRILSSSIACSPNVFFSFAFFLLGLWLVILYIKKRM